MSERFPDIEIYLLKAQAQQVKDWLQQAIGPVTEKGQSKFGIEWQIDDMAMLFTPNSSKNFCSLWFKTNHTPWGDDLACARAAHEALGCEVRCSKAGWQEGDAGPGWIKLIRGEEKPLDWDN